MQEFSNGYLVDPFILFAEDDDLQTELIRLACQRAGVSNLSFLIVRDGFQAISYLEDAESLKRTVTCPTQVVTDLNMPLVDGIQLLSWVRSNPHFKGLPVSIVTGNPTQEDKAKAELLRCNGFHSKPATFEDLVRLMKSIFAVPPGDPLADPPREYP